jgi:hypothetical protein
MNKVSNTQDKEEERMVKQLNQEIMFVFEKHNAPFGHASASLLSVLYFISERYGKAHPENRKIMLDYFRTEFDKFLNKFENV